MILRKYGLGDKRINVESRFNSASVRSREDLLSSGNETIKNEIEDWENTYKTTYDFYVCDSLIPSVYANTFQYKGLTSEFSKIKTIDDVGDFANKYGLLGFSHPNPKSTWPTHDGYSSLDEFYNSGETSRYGESELTIEPVQQWLKNVNEIRKLMKIYRLLRKNQKNIPVEFEEKLITFKPWSENSLYYSVYWYDDERTTLFFNEDELNSLSLVDIHRKLLVDTVSVFINNGIKIVPNVIESSKTPLGFYVSEIPTTNSLQNTIFYDLWKMLGEEINIEICSNSECKMPFIKNKRQEYCSPSCKQQAYRNRKKHI